MKLIGNFNGKEIWLHNYTGKDEINLPVSFRNHVFVCLLWSNRKNFVAPKLVKKLLEKKCKHFLAGGEDCDRWEFAADDAHISMYPDFRPPDTEHMLTSSSKDKSLEEVIWETLNNTNFDDYDFKKFLIIQIDRKFSADEIRKMVEKQL